MSQDHITYVLATGVVADFFTKWTGWLLQPTLQEWVYIVTIGWLLIQSYIKLAQYFKGKSDE